MNEVVFNTLAEANTLQSRDYLLFIGNTNVQSRVTTAWAKPCQRIDGKWAYPCLDGADYTGYTIEEYNDSNYPQATGF